MQRVRKMKAYRNIDEFLDRLERVSGKGNEYRACCPVHKGNNKTAVKISYDRSGDVWAYCFNCNANTYEIAQALGIRSEKDQGIGKPVYPKVQYYTEKEQIKFDRIFLETYENTERKGGKHKLKDKLLYRQVKSRVEEYDRKMREWFEM
jgi:hypothetical protein